MLGFFAANSSLGVFVSLCESSTRRSFLGKCAGLVCCKAGRGAGCFHFVGGARTMPFKLRWNRVDLNRDNRFSRDTEMPTSDISFQNK